ncbi:transposase [Streptomyces sp. NPDC001076]
MDAKVAGYVCDRAAARADLADGSLAEFIGVLTGCWHCWWFSLRLDRNPGFRDSTKARAAQFLTFFKQVAREHPRVKLHVVVDNYATRKHVNVKTWPAKNPRVTLHFTPTSCSWLNMVEIFFGIITRQAIRRGTFESIGDLRAAILTFIDGYNTRCEPFTWTKTADQILNKIKCK